MMPRLSEIDIGQNDILIPDVSDDAIAATRARGFDSLRDGLAGASVIVLDDEL